MEAYQVMVLIEGYSKQTEQGLWHCDGTVTLLKGPHNILVDTGSPWDREVLIERLKQNSLSPENIEYVVCTHGHSDHVGNLNLFTRATQIVSHDICKDNMFMIHDFKAGIPYEIGDHVEVVSTPGHTCEDVSVIVKNTAHGTVVIAGDVFECFEDLETPELWQENSAQPDIQYASRIEILKIADVIIPGHGPMFKVPERNRNSMVMISTQDE